jgi:hypothetical protein
MGAQLSAAISWIGDQLAAERYFDDRLAAGQQRCPQFEFLRDGSEIQWLPFWLPRVRFALPDTAPPNPKKVRTPRR